MIATMTASAQCSRTAHRFLPGWGNIFRKELKEWLRTRRFVVTSVLMALLVGAVPVITFVANGGLHDGRLTADRDLYAGMITAWTSLSLTLGAFLIVALTMGSLLKEEDAGTAQWLFTKPISRVGYGLAKWAANSSAVIVAAVLIPGLVYFGLLQALFSSGIQHGSGALAAAGLTAFHATVVIAIVMLLSTWFRSQAPVAGIAISLNLIPFLLTSTVSLKVLGFAPGLMDYAAIAAATGQRVGTWQPVVTALVLLPLCLAGACERLRTKPLQ
jgi:ABC-2 type transport system permease protein